MRTPIRLAIILAAALAAAGQEPQPAPQPAPQPSPSPSPGGTPGSTGRPGTQPTPMPTPDNRRQPTQQPGRMEEMPRPIFLSGRVMLDDGTPPPDSVVIERVCNGVPRPEAYTDSKGHFSIQLGMNTAVMADASVSSSADSPFDGPMSTAQRSGGFGGFGGPGRGVTEQQLMGCELRASLAGFRSESVMLAGRRMMDNPDVGVIILHRLANVEGTTISITSLNAPKDAKKAYEKGREALKKKKLADAQKELQKAVTAYPKYAAAWYELGRAHEAQNNAEEARKCYASSLEADGKFLYPYMQMAGLAARDRKWQEVADTTDRLIRLDPVDFPQAFFYNSVANYNLGKIEAAEKSAREAQKLDTAHRFPKVNHLLGIILADRRDYGAAAEQMRNYLKFAPNATDAATVRGQLSELEKLAGPPQQQ